MIDDPALPAAAHLLGPGAEHLVAAGLEAVGGELVSISPTQVIYRPGSELTVRYDARVRWADGREVTEVLCTGTTRHGAPAGTVPLAAGGMEAGLWRYPFDPSLPGLEHAAQHQGVAAVAGAFVGSHPELRVRAYRPGRRAVVQARGDGREVYLKVVRPAAVAGMVAVHRALGPHLPVPQILAGDPTLGILVLEALPGEVLRDRLRGDASELPSAAAVLDLSDRLAEVPALAGVERLRPILRNVTMHLTTVARALPSVAERAETLRRALVTAGPGAPSPAAGVVIHGDLHEAQLLVDGAEITGLLDIDGVGPGDPADDLGRLLGHLSALALGAGDARPGIEAYAAELRDAFATRFDRAGLDLRAAAIVVGLAVGPFRVQMPDWEDETRRRLDLAMRWIDGRPFDA